MASALPILGDSFLDEIEIATPCEVEWSDMLGDERVRRCDACKLDVYNISSMTRADAAKLISERERRVCIRMFKRHDGTLITRDCGDVLRHARRRGPAPFAAVVSMVFVFGFIAHACGGELVDTTSVEEQPTATMGEVAVQADAEPSPRPLMGAPAIQPRPLMGKVAHSPETQKVEVISL